jgi:hypothetical protein
MFRGGN